MVRKFLGGLLMVFSLSLLVLSLITIWAAWHYNEPLTVGLNARLDEVDDGLEEAQTALQGAQGELERALHFVDSAEDALQTLSEQTVVAKEFLDTVTDVLDGTIKPGLESSREQIDKAQKTLDDLRTSIENLNRIPFVNIPVPDDGLLDSFIEITDSLESEIFRMEDIAAEASTFLSDTSYLMGGDLQETRDNIIELQEVVDEYEGNMGDWREQVTELQASLPGWIDNISLFLMIFLAWFAFSQVSLALHGLTLLRGRRLVGDYRL